CFLATSRERLRVASEHAHELEPLSLPTARDDIEASEAVQLFVDRASLVQTGYALDTHEAPIVAEIVRRLEGMPLAIQLAAARMGALGSATLLERLESQLDVLATRTHGVSSRQRTLRGALEWSWKLLKRWEQDALAQCSVFRGGFGLDAAERVIDLSG